MCGILGSFVARPAENLEMRIRAGVQALRHRGPDDMGVQVITVPGGTLALGHTRLSIIDLTAGGHQPMTSEDGRWTIVYNGEVYNYQEIRKELAKLGYRFRTESDTEVLLAAWDMWGVESLRRLIGMFAFAVVDRHERTLSLVRDAFGIKPLFYAEQPEGYAFASELPALMAITNQRARLNLHRTYDYLVRGNYDNTEQTFFEGLRSLPPGHLIRLPLVELADLKPTRWWWPGIAERTHLNFEQAAEHLRESFLSNVRLHLRSDVPLGAALSGGIDSSAVVCAMRRLEPEMPIHTFSFVAPNSSVDEEPWMDMVNAHVSATVHKVVVSPKEMVEDIDDMILAQGEPFGSTSIYAQYRVFRLARERGMIVTLDGQGADELLAGYSGYPHSRVRSMIERREITQLVRFIGAWSRWPNRGFAKSVRLGLRHAIPDGAVCVAKRLRGNLRPIWLDRTFAAEFSEGGDRPNGGGSPEEWGRRLPATLREVLTGKGLQALLRHGDRNSMRWSIESRVPFLTIDMAEFLLSLPEQYLLSQRGETKHIFRRAMRGIVPDSILDRKDKIGFGTPQRAWLTSFGDTALEWVDVADDIPFLDGDLLRNELGAALNGRRGITSQSWRILNFCRWLQLVQPVI